MHIKSITLALSVSLSLVTVAPRGAEAAGYRLIGWNNLGMHCMDGDYSVLSLLPPYNTFHAQLIGPTGKLVKVPGSIRVTYEAVSDPSGSINTSSIGKTNFWENVDGLFGASISEDHGLAGYTMPGATNTPQAMAFDSSMNWFVADGVPITPTDDAGHKNAYPMMKLVARDGAGAVLATTSIVLPVSDEMSCKSCHASNSSNEAAPASGWVNDPDEDRDFRLNILRLHDDAEGNLVRFQEALATAGYNPAGLEATVREDGRAILCATCHSSEALPGSGLPGIQPLTRAIHNSMANSFDPKSGMRLDDVDNRSACYTCHPGSATKCLRGAMGAAVAADGSMSMQCQSCHGDMKTVGASTRTGWFDEPRCESCHTGTAMVNSGAIRFDSVFRADGLVREALDATFATNDDTPAAGISLYRFSKGHGGLQCSGCHGSTHAEYPSSHSNDNIQSVAIQGHKGVIAECKSCHATTPVTIDGGPHGLHPIGASWVEDHGDAAEDGGAAACRSCHGSDYRGTVLSRALGDRTFSTDFGTKKFWKGFQVGCYNCHRGPSSESANSNRAAVVVDASASTGLSEPVTIPLSATDADGNTLTLRIVSQPAYGTVGLVGKQARYYPDGSFTGEDTFTFAAWDGSTDSNLGVVRVNVDGPPCPVGCETPTGCDLNCGTGESRDAMVVAPKPLHVNIGAGRSVVDRVVKITVADVDPQASLPGVVRLDVLDGDCPAGTVAGAATFPAGGDSVVLGAGSTATAQVRLHLVSSAFTTPGARAPARCHLKVRTVVIDATDPMPENDEADLELNVLDRNDFSASADSDVFLSSFVPMTVEIPAGQAMISRVRKPQIVLDAPAGGPAVEVQATSDDGSCPTGTIGLVDLDPTKSGTQDIATLGAGASLRGRLTLRATAGGFSSLGSSPMRCTAFVFVTYTGPGGEVSNDLAEVVVTVLDHND